MDDLGRQQGVIPRVHSTTSRLQKYVGFLLFLTVIYSLYFAREFLTPIVLAFLLSLTLSPVVRFLARHSIPPARLPRS